MKNTASQAGAKFIGQLQSTGKVPKIGAGEPKPKKPKVKFNPRGYRNRVDEIKFT